MAKGKMKLNARQQKYKNNLISGMTKYNAAIAAGYSENTALKHTSDLDKRVGMPDVMEQAGMTNHYLAHKLLQLLNANKVVGYLHQYKKGEKGGTEKCEPDEAVSNEFIEIADWGARAKGLEIAFKLNGSMQQKGDQNIANFTQMTVIQMNGEPLDLDIGEIPENIRKRMGK